MNAWPLDLFEVDCACSYEWSKLLCHSAGPLTRLVTMCCCSSSHKTAFSIYFSRRSVIGLHGPKDGSIELSSRVVNCELSEVRLMSALA